MPEIEREGILEQRLEELQHFQDVRNVDQMLKAQKGGEAETSKVPKRTRSRRSGNLVTYRRDTQDLKPRVVGIWRNPRS
jgi:RNA polymerase-associated protein RTF1